MAKANVPVRHESIRTHEGAPAMQEGAEKELRRTISTCMMFENSFYEGGDSIAARIFDLAAKVDENTLIEMIAQTKKMGLRHAPLWAAVRLATLHKGHAVGDAIASTITRADELAEFLAMYWRKSPSEETLVKRPVTKQMKLGLASAFSKFDAYQFAKYNRDGAVKLRDVMFLVHPKPDDTERAELYKMIALDILPIPDTWEVALSAGQDKKATWERLISEHKLGALALLRNLRNMEQANVDRQMVINAMSDAKVQGILPFQYVTAWLNAPSYARAIDEMMLRSATAGAMGQKIDLAGTTCLVVDVSGSMDVALSSKGTATRIHAAGALAAGLIERSQDMRLFTFSNSLCEVQPVRGLGAIDVIAKSQPHSGTHLGRALEELKSRLNGARVVVITDEQTHDSIPQDIPSERKFMINVAPYHYGVAVDKTWTRVSGFSPMVVDWIVQEEADRLFVAE